MVIPLPLSPLELEVNENTNKVYILSEYALYSLDEKTNNLTTISVSEPLSNIEVNEDSNIIYLTSEDSDSLFAIHGPKHKVAVGVIFNVSPSNSGRVLCGDNKTEYPLNQYLYEEPGITCVAQANSGFEFIGWSENIGSNITRPLKPCMKDFHGFFDFVLSPIQKNFADL